MQGVSNEQTPLALLKSAFLESTREFAVNHYKCTLGTIASRHSNLLAPTAADSEVPNCLASSVTVYITHLQIVELGEVTPSAVCLHDPLGEQTSHSGFLLSVRVRKTWT